MRIFTKIDTHNGYILNISPPTVGWLCPIKEVIVAEDPAVALGRVKVSDEDALPSKIWGVPELMTRDIPAGETKKGDKSPPTRVI